MIPVLDKIPQLDPKVAQFLDALEEQDFAGDIARSYAERLSLATDNSVYQQLPSAILFPKETADLVRITKLAQREEFRALTFTPRGGGTGTNGQSLNQNIIVDLSRHMTGILELNLKERWVRVQAGVVKDQLNAYLKPYGLFFAPELSTSNRATLGGMISTDASGQGSLKYGKTSHHVLALRSVLMNGEVLETKARSVTEMAQAHPLEQAVFQRCQAHRQAILRDLPQLNRFLTGYDLKHVFNDSETEFNLSRIITGAEGTLAFVCEATLNLTPIPQFRGLINIQYTSFDAALRNAPFLVQAKALSVETVDSKVLNLAKEDIIWHSVKDLLRAENLAQVQGLNIVEFAGDDPLEQQALMADLCQKLDEKIAQGEGEILGYQCCEDLDSIQKIYAMRKKAVGLLGNAKGRAKPIPFVEDTCVPPENLADYIREFRQLLDEHQLNYGMFGHVDAGVLHVRPALDLTDKAQVALFKQISDSVADLTQKYGGLIWGEHGKGVRGEYNEKYFTPELWRQLRTIKGLFDPENRLNPGKICTPLGNESALFTVLSPMRADKDRHIPLKMRDDFKGALNCNGNGLCFNFDVHSAMCPSMKVSRNRLLSPKGRASMVREWLYLLAQEQVDPQDLAFQKQKASLRQCLTQIQNSWQKKQGKYDFSHEVKKALDSCLACKACASQCPIKIDVPQFKSLFLHNYHQRYLRSAKDHIVANVEKIAPIMAKVPQFFNFFSQHSLSQKFAQNYFGLVDLPALSVPNLAQQLVEIGVKDFNLAQLRQLNAEEKAKTVLIVQDPFTSYYDAKVVADCVRLLKKLAFNPVLLPFKPNGKAQHIKGFLQKFAQTAQNQADFLNQLATLNIPMIGVDPAIVLSYADEYTHILGEKRGDFKVWQVQEWLSSQQENFALQGAKQHLKESVWYLFPHCTESTMQVASSQQWQQLFALFNAKLEIEKVGCCGMAGTFGHETAHLAMSKAIYAQSWQEKLKGKDLSHCLATGFSCRSQVERMEKRTLLHPVQALLTLLDE